MAGQNKQKLHIHAADYEEKDSTEETEDDERGEESCRNISRGSVQSSFSSVRATEKDDQLMPEVNDYIKSHLENKVVVLSVAVAVVVLLFAVVLVLFNSNNDTKYVCDGSCQSNVTEHFVEEMWELQDQFQNQDKLMWTTIKASIKSVLNSSTIPPLSPSVIMLISMETVRPTVRKLTEKLASVANKAFNKKLKRSSAAFVFDSIKVKELNGDDAKLETDNVLREALQNTNVVVLFNIHEMPFDSALILHSYCDSSNAPFKDVVLLLTLICDDDLIQSKKSWNEVGDLCLRETFLRKKGLNEDKIGALLTRIANSAVVVVKEEKLSQEKNE